MDRRLDPRLPRRRSAPGTATQRSAGALLAVLAVLALLVVACDGGTSGDAEATPAADELEATGVIVAVRGSITEVEEFDLALSDGGRITFDPGPGALERAGFSPAHLREHMALTEPITVIYREDGELNVMVGIGDAAG